MAQPYRDRCEPWHLTQRKLPPLWQSPSILCTVPFTITNMLPCCAEKEGVRLHYLPETVRPLTPKAKAQLYLLLLGQRAEVLKGGHDILVHFVHNA